MNGPDNMDKTMEFDGVICCIGGMREPRMPDMEVSPDYKGRVMHQQDFVDRSIFKNKRVLVIGIHKYQHFPLMRSCFITF